MQPIEPSSDLCDDPLEVFVHGDAVVLLGPDGVNLSMTADAAARSAVRLKEAAEAAAAHEG